MAPRRAERMSTRGAGYRGNGPAGCSALAGMLLCSWPATGARAQGQVQPQAAELPRVIVTARRVQEDAQNVPAALTTLSAEEVDRFDISTLEKASAILPGLIITRGNAGSGASINLRGIGPNFSSIGIEQSVAVVVDGVYHGQGRIIDEAFFDLTQVDLLKGPQALYWGKNSTAGVISFTSANPTKERELMARVGYEFKNENRTAAFVISGPVADKFGLRLAVHGQDMHGGYVRNEAPAGTYTTVDAATRVSTPHAVPLPSNTDLPAERLLFARLTATYQPDDSLDLNLKATAGHHKTGSTAWNDRLWKCPNGSAGEPCGEGFTVRQNPIPPDIAATRPDMNRHGGQPYTLYDSRGLTFKLDKKLPTLTLSSITNYQRYEYSALSDFDFTGRPLIWSDEHDHYRAFSSELRVNTTFDGPLNVMAGLYVQRTRLVFARGSALNGVENSLASPSDRYLAFTKDSATDGKTSAAYGQVTWKFLPDWEYALGARYTDERKTSYFVQPYVNPAYAPVYPPNARLDADQHFHDLSPATTLTWKPSRTLTTYAGYKTGYKSGGFSNSATISAFGNGLSDLAFGPESVKGFEAGAKTILLDNRLRLNADAYHYDYKDLQIDFFDARRLNLMTTNAGSARVKGLEVAAEYLPPALSGLKLTGSAQYNIARYQRYIAPCYGGQTQAEGCRATGATGALRQDLAGQPTANAPRWTASIGADYSRAVMQALMTGVSVRVRYNSAYSVSPFGQPLAVQPSYVNYDASLRLGSLDDRWQLALIGKNLTNKFVATSAFDQSGTGTASGGLTGSPANQFGLFMPPRTVALELTGRF
jgi:iron complex outermembrane receptor protein